MFHVEQQQRQPQTVRIINPDFNISFKSSLNLSYVCIFELAKRDLIYRWRSLPAYALNKVAYAFATGIRQAELTIFADKIARLPAKQEGAPRCNILSVWEQHSTDDSQISESIREYILMLIDYKQPSRAKATEPSLRIPVYSSYKPINHGWRRKKNTYATKLDDTVLIIKRMARRRDLAKSTAQYLITNLTLWADLTDEKLAALASSLHKLSEHPKLETDDANTVESIAFIIHTGEIKKMSELAKKDYSLEDTFLGATAKPISDAEDKLAKARGRARLDNLVQRLRNKGEL